MTFNFLFFLANSIQFFNLLQKKKKIIEKYGLLKIKAVEIFEYKKNNNKYQDRAKLHKQIVNKALFIAKILYVGYLFLFLFDNAINYLVYIKDAFQI